MSVSCYFLMSSVPFDVKRESQRQQGKAEQDQGAGHFCPSVWSFLGMVSPGNYTGNYRDRGKKGKNDI